MKSIVTGSLGNISKPLAVELVQKGHIVTVISSNPEKQKEIEDLGANAAIGSLEDVDFLSTIFLGADAVYSMVPPNNYFDHSLDLDAYYSSIGRNYKQAIERSGVKRVVNLSTIGAHLDHGNGILIGAHHVQNILNELPADVSITHVRPTSFYYNLLGYIPMIKSQGFIAANYGGEDIVPWVSPIDIASAVAEEMGSQFKGRKVRYVASEEMTCNDTAALLGAAIGMDDLKWTTISNKEMLDGLVGVGMAPAIAAGLVEMYEGLHTGFLLEDYYKNKPSTWGKVKVTDYAKEFATVFNQK